MKLTYEGVVYDGLSVEEAVELTRKLQKKAYTASTAGLGTTTVKRKYTRAKTNKRWSLEEATFLVRNIGLKPSILSRCTELRGRTPAAIGSIQWYVRHGKHEQLAQNIRQAVTNNAQ